MNPIRRLLGKVAIVTGATSGVGESVAHMFAAEGARVMLTGLDEAGGLRVRREIELRGTPSDSVAFVAADLTNVDACRSVVTHGRKTFGGVDILVNNAADYRRGRLEDTSVGLWDHHMALNVRAPFILTQACVPLMRARGGGSIVNIGSINAYMGLTKLLSYSVSKGALMTFTKNAAQELCYDRIRINQINPGWILTEGEHRVQLAETGRADWAEQAAVTRPFGRLLSPEDVARAVLFFASDEASMVNGSVLDLDQFPVGSSPERAAGREV
jgi:NAD(P)-dependent dehydrogenase (short-subunit alcohol dehydrogenase family)